METSLECIPCFIKQALQALKSVCTEKEDIHRILQKVLVKASEFDLQKTPPEMGQIIHRLIRTETGDSDPYEEVKNLSTQKALDAQDLILKRIRSSADPFETSLRYAIAGNILDFAILSLWNEEVLKDSLDMAETKKLDLRAVKKLKENIDKADTILYLGDNAGETVFDKLFIKTFSENKKSKVFYAVKSNPVINDAVRKDALMAGLDQVSEIIENGTDAPGTVLNQCSQEFMNIYRSADLVISKGQANFETLNREKGNIFFLTQIKCPVIGDSYGYTKGEWVVLLAEKSGHQEE